MERTLAIGSLTFRYKHEQFKEMRRFVFQTASMSNLFVHQLAELFDNVREMKVGDEIYFCDSDYEVYHENTLERLEQTLNMMERASKVHGEQYTPHWGRAKCIKKTAKCYILKEIDSSTF